MSICYPYVIPAAAAAAYTGPGDVVSGATAWWGLRAYSAAKAATAPYTAIRITDSGAGNATDINILTTGVLDMATLNAWIVAHGTPFVTRFYDQAGSCTFESATGVHELVVSPTGLTAGRVAMRVSTGNGFSVISGSVTAAAQPITLSWAVNNSGASSEEGWLFSNSGGNFVATYNGSGGGAGGAANTVGIHSNTRVTTTATDAAWHAVQGIYNSGSSPTGINVDGSMTTLNPGTNGIGTTDASFLINAFGQDWRGDFVELGIWPSVAFSGTQCTNMSTNQHSYWGFS